MILMTNNQWKCDENKPAWADMGLNCAAESRVGGLLKAYRAIGADVLALQEVSVRMSSLMMAHMDSFRLDSGDTAHYEYISGGDTPIIYRQDRLKLLESGFFRYDESVPGLEGSFNNAETKSWCWGTFEERATGRRLAVMSTHLWWMASEPKPGVMWQPGSGQARAYQISLACGCMAQVMGKYSCLGIIMGDLNASIHSQCLSAAFGLGWQEAHDLAAFDRDERKGHHPCNSKGYSRGDAGSYEAAIDHILIKNQGDVQVDYYRRLMDEWFDPISDHYPLYINISWPEDTQA